MVAMFQFNGGGIGVMPDPADNAAGHDIPNHEAGTQISFQVVNVGDESGIVQVDVEVDDIFNVSWRSSGLNPGQQQAGFASLGRLPEGSHTVSTALNPGSGSADHEANTFDVG
jgi:hypothetical protein